MHAKLRASLILLAAAAGLATSHNASAYRALQWTWTWQQAPMNEPFEVNVASFPAAVGSPAEVEAALHSAQDIWADEGMSGFAYNWGGVTTRTSFTSDGRFISQYSNTTAGGGTLATSQSWGFGNRMTECDQRYYAANAYGAIAWSADPNGARFNEIDLETTAIHENGHCLGLDHSAIGAAIMYASTTGGNGPADRHLHPDDVSGVQSIYGVTATSGINLEIGGAMLTGVQHTFTVTGANPNELVYLLYSQNGTGQGPCPSLLNSGAICMDIRGPIRQLGNARADNQGRATIRATVGAQFEGWTIGFQAGVLRGPNNADTELSAPLSAVGLNGGITCAAGAVPDCAGACYDQTWLGDGDCDDGAQQPWGRPNFFCDSFADDAGDCP